jgi:hypothetical protein
LEFQRLSTTRKVTVRWCPGHEGIEGNERADALAKRGAAQPIPKGVIGTAAGVRALARARGKAGWAKWWKEEAAQRYAKLGPGLAEAQLRCPPAFGLPRPLLHHLLAARSGHGDFAAYHRRFNHESFSSCRCGRDKSQEHMVFFRRSRKSIARWPRTAGLPQPTRDYWLNLIADPNSFATFADVTGYFKGPAATDTGHARAPSASTLE